MIASSLGSGNNFLRGLAESTYRSGKENHYQISNNGEKAGKWYLRADLGRYQRNNNGRKWRNLCRI